MSKSHGKNRLRVAPFSILILFAISIFSLLIVGGGNLPVAHASGPVVTTLLREEYNNHGDYRQTTWQDFNLFWVFFISNTPTFGYETSADGGNTFSVFATIAGAGATNGTGGSSNGYSTWVLGNKLAWVFMPTSQVGLPGMSSAFNVGYDSLSSGGTITPIVSVMNKFSTGNNSIFPYILLTSTDIFVTFPSEPDSVHNPGDFNCELWDYTIGSATWTSKTIGSATGDATQCQIAQFANGDLVEEWFAFTGAGDNILASFSTNNGATWSMPVQNSNTYNPVLSGTVLTVNSSLALVSGNGAYMETINHLGGSWNSRNLIASQGIAGGPSSSMSANHHAEVTWAGPEGTSGNLVEYVSIDSGVTWGTVGTLFASGSGIVAINQSPFSAGTNSTVFGTTEDSCGGAPVLCTLRFVADSALAPAPPPPVITTVIVTRVVPCNFYQEQCWWEPTIFYGMYVGLWIVIAASINVRARSLTFVLGAATSYASLYLIQLGELPYPFAIISFAAALVYALRLDGVF